MKESTIPMQDVENTRNALDQIERAFGVRSGIRAGLPGAESPAWSHSQGKPFHPQVIALYGVVIAG